MAASAWPLGQAVTAELDQALDRGRLSIRGYDRVLRVAWTGPISRAARHPGRSELGRAIVLRQRARVAA